MKDLGSFIRENMGAIRDEWLGEVRLLPSTSGKPAGVLLDHLPELLDRMVRCLEAPTIEVDEADLAPYAQGYHLHEVVTEYCMLRRVVLDFAARSPGLTADARARAELTPHQATLTELIARSALRMSRLVEELIALTEAHPEGDAPMMCHAGGSMPVAGGA